MGLETPLVHRSSPEPGRGCSSVPQCLFPRYLFISLSSGVMFELFSLSLDLSIISKIMKFPNVALSGCIPIPPSLPPFSPSCLQLRGPGDVKTKKIKKQKPRGGAAGDGEKRGSGEGVQPFPAPGCSWSSPTCIPAGSAQAGIHKNLS